MGKKKDKKDKKDIQRSYVEEQRFNSRQSECDDNYSSWVLTSYYASSWLWQLYGETFSSIGNQTIFLFQ